MTLRSVVWILIALLAFRAINREGPARGAGHGR
jgi:hypothetical protein